LRDQAAVFDRLLAAVSEEYRLETREQVTNSEQRLVRCVERLLAGELGYADELGYDLEVNHIGLLATGAVAEEAVAELATTLDCRLLRVRREDGTLWAWLGARHALDPCELQRHLPDLPSALTLAVGEPGEGFAGWHLTHRQAVAAMVLARHRPGPLVRYRDVALLAAVVQDDVLHASLTEMYMRPLEQARDGGSAAKETLRAYFRSGSNVSSTAATLGVTRNTVTNRLRAVEDVIGQSVTSCASALEAALLAAELDSPPSPGTRSV
jgi:hypothetical protein